MIVPCLPKPTTRPDAEKADLVCRVEHLTRKYIGHVIRPHAATFHAFEPFTLVSVYHGPNAKKLTWGKGKDDGMVLDNDELVIVVGAHQ